MLTCTVTSRYVKLVTDGRGSHSLPTFVDGRASSDLLDARGANESDQSLAHFLENEKGLQRLLFLALSDDTTS